MSTPPIADSLEGPKARKASSFGPKTLDSAPYIEKIHSWNSIALQPWSIAMLVQSDRIYAVVERKELAFDLLDWFEDTRVGAVMRGEKVLSEESFWLELYRQSAHAIERHFGELPVRVVSTVPAASHRVLFGTKSSHSQHASAIPSPIETRQTNKTKKRHFKTRP